MAGSAAALNYEVYCYFIMVAFCQAATAFVSQNYGAGLYDRCRRAFRLCMIMSVVGVGLANLLIVWQDRFFLGIFSSDPTVVDYGITRLHYVLLLQFMASSYEISGSALRGLGYSMTPMVLTVFGTCVLRLVWIYTVCASVTDFSLLLSVYPISWAITGAAVYIAYRRISTRLFNDRLRKIA